MRHVQVREAKAGLSALIEAAEKGQPTTITRHGKPAAVLVPVADAGRLYGDTPMSFIDFLRTFPNEGIDLERDQTPMRDIDL